MPGRALSAICLLMGANTTGPSSALNQEALVMIPM